ncbi:MAG: hypothetical protein SFT68_03645 [Rickettsiaceae bacterium]|nr:hypothetical protein [Rickettsiaceae bacterium]
MKTLDVIPIFLGIWDNIPYLGTGGNRTVNYSKLKETQTEVPLNPVSIQPKTVVTATLSGCSVIEITTPTKKVFFHDAAPGQNILDKVQGMLRDFPGDPMKFYIHQDDFPAYNQHLPKNPLVTYRIYGAFDKPGAILQFNYDKGDTWKPKIILDNGIEIGPRSSDFYLSGYEDLSKEIGDMVDPFFGKYTLDSIKIILKLRVDGIDLDNIEILNGNYVFTDDFNNFQDIDTELNITKSSIVLAPLSLYNKHAVGLMFVKHESVNFTAYYIDPSNEVIPKKLEQIFISKGLQTEHLVAERQKYANCGPEVIENFILYLTGERLAQEEAIIFHSKLLETELMLDKPQSDLGDSNELFLGIRCDTSEILWDKDLIISEYE